MLNHISLPFAKAIPAFIHLEQKETLLIALRIHRWHLDALVIKSQSKISEHSLQVQREQNQKHIEAYQEEERKIEKHRRFYDAFRRLQ